MKNKRITKKGFRYEILPSTEHSPRRVKDYNEYCTLYNRLTELEDKIENRTLIELPCKVGTTLYFIVTEEQEDINGFKYVILESNKWLYVIDKNEEITIEENDLFFKFEYTYDYTFGENVFLTKAEAQARLKELQEKQK